MHDRRRPIRTLCVLLVTAGCLVAPGCRLVERVRGWFNPADDIELARAPRGAMEQELSREQAVKEAQFAPASDRRGLEVRLMVVDDTRYDAPRLLNEIIHAGQAAGQTSGQIPGEIDQATLDRWGAWGFRLVSVPIDRVQALLDAMTPVQPSSVQWLGEFGAWRAVVRAGEMRSSSVRVGDSLTRLDRGRPSLIARSWVEPVFTDSGVGAALRLDLGMQIQSRDRGAGDGFFDPTREQTIEDSGSVIDPLLCSLSLGGGRALVIVGEAPGASWDELPQPVLIDETAPPVNEKDGEAGDDEGLGPRPGEERRPDAQPEPSGERTEASRRPALGVIEPQRPTSPSLGELMLTTSGSRIVRTNETRVLPKRVIVVLIPRVPATYQILPGSITLNGGAP